MSATTSNDAASARPGESTTNVYRILADYPLFPESLNHRTYTVRHMDKVLEATEQSEGVGARVRRSIGTRDLRNLSPFLMLDHFSVSKGAGFPDHPHRGQETITYLLQGAVDHEDFTGSKGTIRAGDLQFMTAGRGIVHAEMPAQESDVPNEGMQLWVDLPKQLKDTAPRYRDLLAAEIPQANSPDGKVHVKVISGRSYGVDSLRDLAYTPVWYLDVTVKPGGKFVQEVPDGWTSFAYMLSGKADFGGQSSQGDSTQSAPVTRVDQYHIGLFKPAGDEIVAHNPEDSTEDAHFVFISGVPLDQKIVQFGPFVVTDEHKVQEAVMDFQTYKNGFERARNWSSEIGKVMR